MQSLFFKVEGTLSQPPLYVKSNVNCSFFYHNSSDIRRLLIFTKRSPASL